MIDFYKIYKTVFTFAIAALWCFILPAQSAYAGCVPGLPCQTAPSASQLLNPSTGPNAAKNDGDESCDANFMNQIYAKAFMEAERGTVMANSMILKTDSVLEYTCYDQLAAMVARNSNFSPATRPFFGETDRWAPASISYIGGNVNINVDMGAGYLDNLINILVLESLTAYATGSFSYDFLGGTATGDNNTFSTTVAGVQSVCDFMYNLHYISKCDDFALNTGFMSFEAMFGSTPLVSNDPRTLPVACPSTHGITSTIIDVAKNDTWNFASFDPVDTAMMNLPITNDPSGGACDNVDPIPTGVIVSFEERDIDLAGQSNLVQQYTYEDKVCSNPACYFDNKDNGNPGDDECVP